MCTSFLIMYTTLIHVGMISYVIDLKEFSFWFLALNIFAYPHHLDFVQAQNDTCTLRRTHFYHL